ncbi:MAG: hypothetical protein K0S39_1927 [Paenibacillus sp.]|jgi:hypothetical protein|nr:hypothetical protein [Paenibacillus sp.]
MQAHVLFAVMRLHGFKSMRRINHLKTEKRIPIWLEGSADSTGSLPGKLPDCLMRGNPGAVVLLTGNPLNEWIGSKILLCEIFQQGNPWDDTKLPSFQYV